MLLSEYPLLLNATVFDEMQSLHELHLPGFNDRMRERLIKHLGYMATRKQYISNTTFSLLYTLIQRNKIKVQFVGSLSSLPNFWFVNSGRPEIVGGYNFHSRKIEIYIYWNLNSTFIINYTSEKTLGKVSKLLSSGDLESDSDNDDHITSSEYYHELTSVCNKLYSIIASEALLVYDYKFNGQLSKSEIVKKWYYNYFSNVINDTLRRNHVGEEFGAMISEMYGEYMFTKVFKNMIEGKSPGVEVKMRNASQDLELDGIPTIKKGKKVLQDVFEDSLKKLLESKEGQLQLDGSTYKSLEQFTKDFGEFVEFIYSERDLPFTTEQLSQSADPSTFERENKYKEAIYQDNLRDAEREEQERYEKALAKQEREFLRKNYHTLKIEDPDRLKDDLRYQWEKQLESSKDVLQGLTGKKISAQIKALGDGRGKKVKPGETYIATDLIGKQIAITDIELAERGTSNAICALNNAEMEIRRSITSGGDRTRAENTHHILRSQAIAYATDLYKLIREKSKNTAYSKEFDLGDNPSFDEIRSILPKIRDAISTQKRLESWLPGRGDSVNAKHPVRKVTDPDTGVEYDYTDDTPLRPDKSILARLLPWKDSTSNNIGRVSRQIAPLITQLERYRDLRKEVKRSGKYLPLAITI